MNSEQTNYYKSTVAKLPKLALFLLDKINQSCGVQRYKTNLEPTTNC